MELTFAQQTAAFLFSLLLGAALGVLYGLLKFIRFTFSLKKGAVFLSDVLFMLAWAMAVFFFSLAFLTGYVRIHVILGSFLGFLTYRLTAGRFIFSIYRPVVRLLRDIFHKICVKLKLIAKNLLKIACKVLYNIGSKKECFRQKRKNKRKILSEKRKRNEVKKTKNQTGKGSRRGNRRTDRGTPGDRQA